jgi:hypothetical protein
MSQLAGTSTPCLFSKISSVTVGLKSIQRVLVNHDLKVGVTNAIGKGL